ncbi:MAG: hypothetical protein CL786_04345, partial [Chloroflexi bacterium]|nr:hypothetical protein [Chloroflexota bacterium]
MKCPSCNKQNPENFKFCSGCGASITKQDSLSTLRSFAGETSSTDKRNQFFESMGKDVSFNINRSRTCTPEEAYKFIESEIARKQERLNVAMFFRVGNSILPPSQFRPLYERLREYGIQLHLTLGKNSDSLACAFILSIVETLARNWLVTPEGFEKPEYLFNSKKVTDWQSGLMRSLERTAVFLLANMLHDKEAYLKSSSGADERLIQRMNFDNPYPGKPDVDPNSEEQKINQIMLSLMKKYDVITIRDKRWYEFF